MSNILHNLSNLANSYLREGNSVPHEILYEIKNNITPNYIGIAQINTITGDFEYNAKKIINYIKFGKEIGLKNIVFPHYALTGALFEDTFQKYPKLIKENEKWLKGIAQTVGDIYVIIGNVYSDRESYKHSLAILYNGNIHFDKTYKTQNFTAVINESLDNFDFSKDYGKNVLINCSAISTDKHTPKEILKLNSDIAKKYKTPVIFINQTGGVDNILFCGTSCAFDQTGNLISKAKSFEEEMMIINPYENTSEFWEKSLELTITKDFSLDYESEMEYTYKAVIRGIKDYFYKCGLKRAVLGLSGGLDSSVCAVLLADALGKNNVLGISMPSHITSKESQSDAQILASNLGIKFAEGSIKPIYDTAKECFNTLFEQIETEWDNRYKKSYTSDNIQARSRAMYLWGISNEFGSCIPIATSDKSEAYMGYATINGDMSGGFAPIADITKTKLFALARWLNRNREEKNAIPESIIQKKPGAELAIDENTGKPLAAEDALMPYEFLDEIIWRIENLQYDYNDLLNTEFLYEKHNNISIEQKQIWLDKFYSRMSKALYKWTIMPPAIILSKNTINGAVYHQPITSAKINYKEVSEEYIKSKLTSI